MSPADVDPRIARTRETVTRATSELLAECGFDDITIEAIADRCGVARSTIYRHWPNRADLLIEGYELLCSDAPQSNTGSFKDDLLLVGGSLASALTNDKWAGCLPSLVGAADSDDELRLTHEQLSNRRCKQIEQVFHRAQARNEISDQFDLADLAENFIAPFFFRRLITYRPLDDAFVKQQVALTLHVAQSNRVPTAGRQP